jgi:hypothetical protein
LEAFLFLDAAASGLFPPSSAPAAGDEAGERRERLISTEKGLGWRFIDFPQDDGKRVTFEPKQSGASLPSVGRRALSNRKGLRIFSYSAFAPYELS